MLRMTVKIMRGLAALILLAALGLGAGFLWYRSAVQPQISGTLSLEGLEGKVEIVRDAEAIPHIFAASETDSAFAQGFVHAQDRLWQMEMNRRIANGRLAELLGPPTLEIDRLIRTLGIRHSAEAIFAGLEPETRAVFEAYANGVNAYLATRSTPLPPEFLLTGLSTLEPWSPVDSIGWTLMMAWDLGGNFTQEMLRLRLAQKGLTLEQIEAFTPDPSGTPWPAPMADLTGFYRSLGKQTASLTTLMAALPGPLEGMGSNNWVVAGALSKSGKPLLANDPHLGLSTPSLWYFCHLSAPDLNVIGASLPGVPGIILGRNDHIAWGFTNTGPDVQDMFIEKINPSDPNTYQTPDGPKAFERRDEIIRVKGAADIKLSVRISRHGPIISDGGSAVAGEAAGTAHAIAFRWSALDAENKTPQAARKMAKARSWSAFREAVKDFHAPQQNMVYADKDGNIGYIAPGRVPIRHPDNDLYGLFPAPGWEARYDWQGYIPFDELPQSLNPPENYRITANERVVAADYPHFISADWAMPYRAERIKALLLAQPHHDLASFAALQADIVSPFLREMLPLMLKAEPFGPREAEAMARLKVWDGVMDKTKPEPLIAAAWMRAFNRTLYADEFGDLFEKTFDQRPLFVRQALLGQNPAASFCDDITTAQRESCNDRLKIALKLALDDLERRFGADSKQWRWGMAHEAHAMHLPFSKVGVLKNLFEQRVETGGDGYSINAARYNVKDEEAPFINTHGPSLRTLFDFDDLEKSRFIHSSGQSGLVLSPFYASMKERWAKGESVPMLTDRASLSKQTIGTLVLNPKSINKNK